MMKAQTNEFHDCLARPLELNSVEKIKIRKQPIKLCSTSQCLNYRVKPWPSEGVTTAMSTIANLRHSAKKCPLTFDSSNELQFMN